MKLIVINLILCTSVLITPVLTFCQEEITIRSIDQGIKLEDNQIFISDECRRLISDAAYRNQTYPEKYDFETVAELLQTKKYTLALWYLINLYQDAPIFTLQLVKDLCALDISPEDYVTAFYTYAYADPKLVSIEGGQYHLLHPDLLEQRIKVTNVLAHSAKKLKG